MFFYYFRVRVEPKREVTKPIAFIRDMLLGRKNRDVNRFPEEIACRTQPPPNLPPGPHSKLSCNCYYFRDARREVKSPKVIPITENGEGCPRNPLK